MMTSKKTITLSYESINKRSTAHLVDYLHYAPAFTDIITKDAGKEHYKLLAEISHQLHDSATIADIGTYYGASALMLSSNPNVNVLTYDIVKLIPDETTTPLTRPNVKMIVKSGLEEMDTIAKCDVVMLDVDPHDGLQEPAFIDALKNKRFRGLLICDDIKLNPGMRSFWVNTCIGMKKMDVSDYAHWAGTGIIVFDPTYIDVVLI